MTILDRIRSLANDRKVTLAELERNLNFSNGSLRKWETSTPSGDKIEKIADYFNVSTDYLLGRTDNPTIASDDTIAGYTSDDLRKMAENAKTFDGKPLTEEDIDAIQNIIEIYLRGR
ncbi:TPA: helix-turn-helix domain-containing protein [Streptococcus pneumoniae]|nr:repressor protein [Streptococcus pneumoniae]HEU5581202.1 helix-turn-helix domain-containing protein [Streptococcus pneumoniae]HEW4884084.1 helix-turn-helix domain-containing protein [Streptococcus pneumoniae]HEW4899431.1 helix-turn-helix domain-containing protein [Streptococcus pneumoniae]